MQKFTFFILIFLSFVNLANAQFTINGTLTNSQNTEALVAANIQIEGTIKITYKEKMWISGTYRDKDAKLAAADLLSRDRKVE